MKLSFYEYQKIIESAVSNASAERRNTFVGGVLQRLCYLTADSGIDSLNPEEVEIHRQLVSMVAEQNISLDKLGQLLDRATAISEEDENHAIDLHPDIVQFWSALDSYRLYRAERDQDALYAISESIMNVLDYRYTGETSIDQWLTVPHIGRELTEQLEDLGARI